MVHIPIPQIAVPSTEHEITTSDNEISHRKHISKPISELILEPNNRGTGWYGSDDRFPKFLKPDIFPESDSDSANATTTTPTADTAVTFGETVNSATDRPKCGAF